MRPWTLVRMAVVAIACAAAVAACGSSSGGSSGGGGQATAGANGGKGPLKTGLILYAPRNSEGWPQAAWQAADRLQKEGKIKLSVVENVAQNSQAVTQVATQMAQNGTQLVIAHSGTWGQAIQDLAPRFSKTDFAWTGTNNTGDNRDNVAAIPFPMYQAGYLAGILSAGVTKTGTLGVVSGFDIPVCHAETVAYQKGAQRVNPKIKVIPSYIGSWTDPDKAKEAVFASADQGADVFLPCGVEPGTISGAKARNATVFGDIVDESSMAPKNLMASLLWDPYQAFNGIVEDIKAGKFRPAKTYMGGIKDGSIKILYNPKYAQKIPAKNRAEVDKLISEVKAGKFTIPYVAK